VRLFGLGIGAEFTFRALNALIASHFIMSRFPFSSEISEDLDDRRSPFQSTSMCVCVLSSKFPSKLARKLQLLMTDLEKRFKFSERSGLRIV
jgi:hypothetical protein